MTNTLAIHIDDDITWIDGKRAAETPMDALDSLDVLLARLCERFSDRMDGGTVILCETTMKRLGFPAKIPRGNSAKTHPVLNSARNVGWSVSEIGPWMTFHRKRFDCPSVHIACLPWLNERTFCFLDEPHRDGIMMTLHTMMFSSLMGVAYRMRPGVTANAALMRMWMRKKPYWSPAWGGIVPADYTREMRYQWTSPALFDEPYEHGWDIRQQYLAAAGVSTVAVNNLLHTGRKRFDNTPGYWLIEIPAWNEPRCPHPAGNFHGGEQAWVTTPTVAYLHEMADRHDVIAEPTVHDSWTAQQGHRVFRSWAERIRDGIRHASAAGSPCVATALKDAYKQAIGLWQTPTGFICRPDWADTVAANARINLHRKIWAQGRAAGGSWPTRINHDCVYYIGRDEIPDVPRTFYEPGTTMLSENIGKFKYEQTVTAGSKLSGKDTRE